MKIALICPTIGQTQRGYERYFSDLFHFIRHQTDIILFKGGGEHSEQERKTDEPAKRPPACTSTLDVRSASLL